VFRRISWLPGGGGLTAPYTRSNRPLWLAGFRVVSAVFVACVLWLLVVFVPRTSSTPVATWFLGLPHVCEHKCLGTTKRGRGSSEGVDDLISNTGNNDNNGEASFLESHCFFTCSIDEA
jgi:hypothetical protein